MSIFPNGAPRRRDVSASPQVSTRDLFNTIFYYRWTVAAIILVFTVLGTVIAIIIPPTYRAEARLLTLYAGYYDMQLDRSGSRAAPSFDPTQVVNVEAQILASPELHRTIVQGDLGSGTDPADLDAGLQRFENRFRIEKIDAANVIELSYVDSDPQHAAHILDDLIAQYFRQRAGVFTQGRVAFLTGQRDKVRAQLDKANAELIAFQRAHDVVNIDEQITGAVALHNLLVQRKLENDSAYAQDKGTLDVLVKEALKIPARIQLFEDNTEAAHALDTMQISLLQLQARRADLAARYMGESPFVQQMDQQIEDVKASIAKQTPNLVSAVRTGHNTYYDTVQDRIARIGSDVAGEVAKGQTLDGQIVESNDRIQTLIAVANQLHRMEIDRDLLVDSFKTFSRQVEQARIEQNQVDTSSSTNVRIIQAPFPPTRRSNPPLLFIAASFVAGILVSGLSVLVLSSVRETFLSPEQIERALDLPVLSAPMSRSEAPVLVQRLRARLLDPVARAMSRGGQARPSPGGGPRSQRAGAEFGRMISAIDNGAEGPCRIVMPLAFRDDDGVDAVMIGLIEGLTRRALQPVLVLDLTTDPGLWGVPMPDGTLTWPGDGRAAPPAAVNPETEAAAGAWFTFHGVDRQPIVIGRMRPDAVLPVGGASAAMLAGLRQSHDYIVLRVPPASRSFLGIEASMWADVTLLAVKAEGTRKPVALTLKGQVLDAGGRIVGVAMTNRHSYIPSLVYRFL
ncbi:MAG: hypothetical protein F8N37_02625 [Telmatospirillum sp.]|nr:hypothetical protein [Telmatospirillum sp.]